MTVAVNCDMGEAFGIWSLGDDEALMPEISLANVACGFHAGDPLVMRHTVRLAKDNDVSVGAAPELSGPPGVRPPGDGDGSRRADGLDPVPGRGAEGVPRSEGMPLSHLKPHGSLYGASGCRRGHPRTRSPTPPRRSAGCR